MIKSDKAFEEGTGMRAGKLVNKLDERYNEEEKRL